MFVIFVLPLSIVTPKKTVTFSVNSSQMSVLVTSLNYLFHMQFVYHFVVLVDINVNSNMKIKIVDQK